MKRKSNYKAKNRGGGRRNPRLRPIQNPPKLTAGWAARLVNDPLELLCFAGLIVFIFGVVKFVF